MGGMMSQRKQSPMSSVTPAAVTAEIEKLRAECEASFRAKVAKLKAELQAPFAQPLSLLKQPQAMAPVAEAKPATNGNHAKPKAATPRRPKSGKGVIRFRDPANPEHTWTGRGKQPNWYKAGLASGKTKEAFAVA